jgi:glycosyltransferase involved in cell wall biosynthesis
MSIDRVVVMSAVQRGTSAEQPMVSVIVPVRNAARDVVGCVESLEAQSYRRDRFEIILVDNGSTDATRDLVGDRAVRLITEDRWPSPYLARNAGIDRAHGEVLAFTDADCRPERTWLEQGVGALLGEDADLVGGAVVFRYSDRPTVAELVDSMWHLDVGRQIEANRACMTANLLVRRQVVDELGGFDSRARSGGDGRWTRRATDAGFRLVFAAEAKVSKPARRLVPLLRKAFRTGRGLPGAWLERGVSSSGLGLKVLGHGVPRRPAVVAARARELGIETDAARLVALWWTSWLVELVRGVGSVRGIVALGRRSPARARSDHGSG